MLPLEHGKYVVFYVRGAQIYQKSRNNLKPQGARILTRGKFHAEDPKVIDATLQI
jgi:hypothetical protein